MGTEYKAQSRIILPGTSQQCLFSKLRTGRLGAEEERASADASEKRQRLGGADRGPATQGYLGHVPT